MRSAPRPRPRAAAAAAGPLLALLAACAGGSPPPAVPRAVPLVPPLAERDGVLGGPATVAWAPDGASLAAIGPEGAFVLDLATGTVRPLSGPGAVAVDWAPAPSPLVVERAGGGARAVAIDPASSARRVLHEAPALVAARWLGAGRGWLAVAAERELLSYGTPSTVTLTADLGRGPAVIQRWTVILPTRDPAADVSLGWAAARPNPVDHALLLPRFRKPPLYAARLQLAELDPFDPVADAPAVADLAFDRWSATACWSPDGRSAALAAGDGTLRIVARDGTVEAPDGPARGLFPAWHPAGDLLFLGGALVTSAGATVRPLLEGAGDAVGAWSPAGDRLAVVAGGRLFVFGGLPVPPPDPAAERRRAAAREAAWELGTLRADGLLAPAVYRERRARARAERDER